jgi:UV DNA damage endonuclease
MPHIVGYCCINTTLQKSNVTTGRGMIMRTFKDKGVAHASQLALQNAKDLLKILKWNYAHNIDVFRMGSGIFPWGTEYDLTTLPDYAEICDTLRAAGKFATTYNQRVTAHPDHFVKLGSTKQNVINNSIKDLELHSTIFDIMGLSASPYNAINIHVGMNYADDVVARWIDSYNKLSPNLQARLVVENDDKAAAFSVRQLYDTLYTRINIPITFDYFHHTFHPDNLTTEEAARLAASTWPDNIIPLFHYSESKNINENATGNPRAHADYVFAPIDDFGMTLHIDLEAKAKELALFKYLEITNTK